MKVCGCICFGSRRPWADACFAVLRYWLHASVQPPSSDTLCTHSDPQKRAVYDLLGEEGLKTEWQVGQKLKSPEEVRHQSHSFPLNMLMQSRMCMQLRAEYEKTRLQRAQADIENLIRSRVDSLHLQTYDYTNAEIICRPKLQSH